MPEIVPVGLGQAPGRGLEVGRAHDVIVVKDAVRPVARYMDIAAPWQGGSGRSTRQALL